MESAIKSSSNNDESTYGSPLMLSGDETISAPVLMLSSDETIPALAKKKNQPSKSNTTGKTVTPTPALVPEIVTSIDWSTYGTGNCHAIKNQGECGACWSFAAISVMECMISIANTGIGPLVPPVSLSVQQLIDCTTNSAENILKFGKNYGNLGCNGGWMSNGWNFIRDWGVMTNDAYPYTEQPEAPCMHDPKKIVHYSVSDITYLTPQNALTHLAKGPITAAISASNDVVRYYSSGVLTMTDDCPS